MKMLRKVVYTVFDGVEDRAEAFLMKIEYVCKRTVDRLFETGRSAVQEGVRIIFGLIEVVVEESFSLAGAVLELIIGKRDYNIPPELPTEVVLGNYGNFELDDQCPTVTDEEDN